MKLRLLVLVSTCGAMHTACKSPSGANRLKSEDATEAPVTSPQPTATPEYDGPTRFFAVSSGNYEVFPADGSVDIMHMSLPASEGDSVQSSQSNATCYQGQVTGLCAVIQKMVKKYNDAQDGTSDSTVWAEVKPETCTETDGVLKFKWTDTLSYDDSTTSGDANVAACDMARFSATSYLQRTENHVPTFVPATTEEGIVGGVDYFSYWTKYDQASQVSSPNLEMLTCKPDPVDATMQLCAQKEGTNDYGGRFGNHCAQGGVEEIKAIIAKMITNSAANQGSSETLVSLDQVAPSKTGKTTIVAYTLGRTGAKFKVARSYALRPCSEAGISIAGASAAVTTFYFPSGQNDNGTYSVIAKGAKSDGRSFGAGVSGLKKDMSCNADGCKLKAVVKSKGCYRGPAQDVCAMVKAMAENTDSSEHIFVGVDGDRCEAGQGGKFNIGVYGLNDYANDDEASSFSGTVEIGACQASQFAGDTFLSERYDTGEEIRMTAKTQSHGSYWLYSEDLPGGQQGPNDTYYTCDAAKVCKYKSKSYYPFTTSCYTPAGDGACKVIEQLRKNTAAKLGVTVTASCKMVGKQEKRLLTKWRFSGGKMTYTLKTGASIRMCGI